MKILVVGGAGYIGSHMVKHLLRAGHSVVVADNFSTGYRNAVPDCCACAELDIADGDALNSLFAAHSFEVVFHFASFTQVGESIEQPGKYYSNNLSATLILLQTMLRFDVKRFIFSSTAAVYGNPQTTPIDEDHPKQPINPYGRSKLMVEQVLEDLDQAHGLKSVSLRYFNAAGADPEGALGERHDPETHLIPLILQAASGRRSEITIFGNDYDTPDGTCIRDYIHVSDLVDAHARALDFIIEQKCSATFNLGNGTGFSVRQVIDAARRITGKDIQVREAARRAGDPARLVADAHRARELLGWQPCNSSLEQIIEDAWHWELQHPWN